MTFDDFLGIPEIHNAWLRENGLQLYVRKSLPYKGLIELANVNAEKMGKGAFTAFLDRIEHLPLKVENVISDRFADFFRRRGWHEIPCGYGCPSFLNPVAVERELGPIRKVNHGQV
jgi:hypothetical protein